MTLMKIMIIPESKLVMGKQMSIIYLLLAALLLREKIMVRRKAA